MFSKTVINVDELQKLVDAVFQYNRRGGIFSLNFFGPDGAPLPVAWVEAASEEVGLSVRIKPDPSPEEAAAATMNRPLLDPHVVLPAASMSELERQS